MPIASGTLEYKTFVKGLITEANALTFPENASIDEENFILNRNGSRQRRLGMDYEASYSLVDTGEGTLTFDDYSVSTYKWLNVAGDASIAAGVVQVGNKLWFVDLYSSSLSGNLLNGGAAVTISGSSGQTPYQYTDINGYLIITTGDSDPQYITYTSASDTMSASSITLKTRDLFGVNDGLAVDNEPSTLGYSHEYNLLNQGWSSTNISSYFSAKGVYPSNNGISYLGRTGSSTFDSNEYARAKEYFGSTEAPKGHFIIDALGERGASRISESGVPVLNSDIEGGQVSCVCSHSGRIFYGGINSSVTSGDIRSPNFTGTVFFSQTVEGRQHFGKCYQEADPTSEQISDLVATDGGFIPIPEANNVLRLISVRGSVVVFSETGVWQISGASGGFSALDYQVNKITSTGIINGEAVVEAEGSVYYWANGGIYTLAPDQVTGLLRAQNISETTVQTLFNDIPSVGKSNAVGNYDPAAKKISWLYEDDSGYDGVSLRNKYTKELVLDLVLGAFYKNSISSHTTNSPFVAGYMPTPDFLTVDNTQQVVANGVPVQVNGVDVIVTQQVRGRGTSVTKYLTFKYDSVSSTYDLTFSSYNDDTFVDWKTVDSTGVDYSSYLITGHEVAGDMSKMKQAPYALFYFKRTEDGFTGSGDTFDLAHPSSCLVQARWDWSDSANSGKWGTQFQAYRFKRNYIPDNISDTFDYGYEVIVTKNKLRGKGRALSLKIESEAGKDMHLLGWAMQMTGSRSI